MRHAEGGAARDDGWRAFCMPTPFMCHLHRAALAPDFSLRPGTAEDVIYDQVVRQNEYLLPNRFAPDTLVVDIGTHVGAFSYLALTRGAAAVVGYEPEPSNHRCAEKNLSSFGSRAHVHRTAVWRSDAPTHHLPFLPSSDAANTGGGSVIWNTEGPLVDAIPFDAVVEAASEGGRRRVGLVKMDCEGAEFPILLTSTLLDRIDHIVGEYHELRAEPPPHTAVPGYSEFAFGDLEGALRTSGFSVTSKRRASGAYGELGLFFAHREGVDWVP
jgi:FkbM family methyltransferase